VIYVIDDEPSILKAFQRLLRSENLPVSGFSSSEEFLKELSVKEGDCLILDLVMPEMNGFSLMEELRLRNISMPIIVVTAHDSPEGRERAKQLGAKAFFRKPVDAQALVDSVNWAMKKNGREHLP
jgi:two-component system, LuxR family, response regulator FixJ